MMRLVFFILLGLILNGSQSFAQCDARFNLRLDTANHKKVYFDLIKPGDTSTTHEWSYGDGTFSQQIALPHTYTDTGKYLVCHTCKSVRQDTSTYCDSVKINGRGCFSDFSYTFINDSTVQFINKSFGNRGYKWSFGDSKFSNEENPKHIYKRTNQVQQLKVKFTIGDIRCKDSETKLIILKPIQCNADFRMFSGNNKRNIEFVSTSTQAINMQWFILENTYKGTRVDIEFPAKLRQESYKVLLTIQGSNGCQDSISKSVSIPASHCYSKYRTAIDTSISNVLFLLNQSFDLEDNTYKWTFGDQISSVERNPQHEYSSFGQKNICLTVANSNNDCEETYCDSLGLDRNGVLLKVDGFKLVVIDLNVGIKPVDPKSTNIKLFPNPFTSVLNYKVEQVSSFEIYNLQGKLVLQEKLMQKEGFVNVAQLKEGSYMIRIKNTSFSNTFKLIKTN